MPDTEKKRRKKINPPDLSRKHWRNLGYVVGTVERNQSFGGFGGNKVDLYGFCDLLAYKPGQKELAFIQAASGASGRGGGDHAKHFWKILCNAHAYELTCVGHQVWLATWVREISGKVTRYRPRFKLFKREEFENPPVGLACDWKPNPRKKKAKPADAGGELF